MTRWLGTGWPVDFKAAVTSAESPRGFATPERQSVDSIWARSLGEARPDSIRSTFARANPWSMALRPRHHCAVVLSLDMAWRSSRSLDGAGLLGPKVPVRGLYPMERSAERRRLPVVQVEVAVVQFHPILAVLTVTNDSVLAQELSLHRTEHAQPHACVFGRGPAKGTNR